MLIVMFKQHIQYIILFIATALLAGCMQPASQNHALTNDKRIQHLQQMRCWEANGRIAINDPKQNVTASFSWMQTQDHYTVRLSSAYTSETVTIDGDQNGFKVTNSSDSNSELHIEKTLPLQQFNSWLKGMPAAGTPQKITYDSHNQIQTLQQDGWLIEYQSYDNRSPVSLPTKMTATDGKTHAKILIKGWQKQ